MRFDVITDYDEQLKYIEPIMQSVGSHIPAKGNGVIFAQFDDAGEVLAFQILQQACFAEGMWARDGSAHLRTLVNMMLKFLEDKGAKGTELLTITRGDNVQGQRIGRFAKHMGFKETQLKVYRRTV